jgi:glycerophosphoryl diester phosphodiesterase
MPQIRPANTGYDGLFQIPTWDEIIELVAAQSITRNRIIGLVPEIKSSTYFASIGLAVEERFLQSRADHAYIRRAPVEIQSFEIANLKYLSEGDGRRRKQH